jgi:hypothetical protein
MTGWQVCHRRRIAEILTERHEFDVRDLSTQALYCCGAV